MTVVVRIRPRGRDGTGRSVLLDDGRRLLLDQRAAAIDLAPGQVLDPAVEETLAAMEHYARAHDAAMCLFRYRLRSQAELVRRLRRRGFTADVVEQVMQDLFAQGLIDDARFARLWAEQRMIAHRLGPHRIRAELRQKGVAADIVESTLRMSVGPEQEMEGARALAARHGRRLSGLPPDVRRRRLVGLLRRRGFSGALIATLLRDIEP